MRLYQAILISLLGHGALLLPLAGPVLPEIPVAPMQVSLNPATPAAHAPQTPARDSSSRSAQTDRDNTDNDETHSPTRKAMAESEPAPLPINDRPAEDTVANRQADIHPADDPTPVIPVSQALREAISRHHAQPQVISRLQQKLKHYFEYPLLARRNGWEGKVVLAMDVYVDGRIYNIQLKSGSGHKILDRSALKAVSRIQALPNMPSWQGSSPLNIHLPVIYRLQG